jgi:type IV pilus assembly protein PilZ
MSEAKPAPQRPSVLSLNINSKSALYAAFMPHLRAGGIFIPTTRSYKIGDEVFMLLSLMDDPAKLPIAGTVVWITPAGAQNGRAQGIGVHFNNDESGQEARRKIEGPARRRHAVGTPDTHALIDLNAGRFPLPS